LIRVFCNAGAILWLDWSMKSEEFESERSNVWILAVIICTSTLCIQFPMAFAPLDSKMSSDIAATDG